MGRRRSCEAPSLGAFVADVVVLISAGLLLGDGGMVGGGCLVLLTMPITICLIAASQGRRARPRQRRDRR